jgi:AcrR family transcriptional regulator
MRAGTSAKTASGASVASPASGPAGPPRPTARRLSAPEREAHIVQEAVHIFAEVGFGGDTRELAKRLGVTQSLLYKYFPNKEALINRVFDVVYMGRWNPFWESVIHDRSVPLQERLTRLYLEYAKAALTRDWVRIFMFSGLRGEGINGRYLAVLRQRILEPIAAELRHEFGLPDVAEVPLKSAEIELVWGINARVFYFGQRQWIFDVPVQDDLPALISLTVEHFLAGARVVLPRLIGHDADQAITSR